MINDERFWESAVAEAVRNDTPPDVTARVLAGLAEPEAAAKPGTKPRGKLRVLRLLGELAVAAAVVVAIGWLTGVLRLPEDPVEPVKVEVAAAPDTRYEIIEGNIELRQGWLLVATGTPNVRCGGSLLEQVDGRVLVHASGVPTREQAEAVLGWLNANRLEMDMVGAMKKWVQGLGMAALVISGSALFDGERIQAQEEPKTEPARWFTVHTVMDIDKLPDDVKLVRGQDVAGAHLEFLAAHDSVESIDFRGCHSLREEHLESLAGMKNLRVLDLRGAEWEVEPDYGPLSQLRNLQELAVDYMPELELIEGAWPPANWEQQFGVIGALRELAAAGVLVTLGNLDDIDGRQIALICQFISTLRELDLTDNSKIGDADLKALSEHKSLQSLNIESCPYISELGLAYLAKANRLSSLRLTAEMTDAIVYQLSRMTNLETLEVPGTYVQMVEGSPRTFAERTRATFEQLATLQKLKRLHWDLADAVEVADFAPLAKLKALTTLSLNGYYKQPVELLALEIANVVPVTALEVESPAFSIVGDNSWLEDEQIKSRLEKLAANKVVTELHLNLYTAAMPETAEDAGLLPEILAKMPALKRVVFQITDSASVNYFKDYAKRHLPNYQVDIIVR